MLRSLTVGLVLVGVLGPGPALAQSIEGVWTLEEREITSGPNAGTVSNRPGLLMIAERHYSQAHETSVEPRPVLSDSPTDEERGRASAAYTSNAGTYERNGSTVTITVQVAASPGRMVPGGPGNLVTWGIEEITATTLVITSTPPGGNVRYRYERVE